MGTDANIGKKVARQVIETGGTEVTDAVVAAETCGGSAGSRTSCQ